MKIIYRKRIQVCGRASIEFLSEGHKYTCFFDETLIRDRYNKFRLWIRLVFMINNRKVTEFFQMVSIIFSLSGRYLLTLNFVVICIFTKCMGLQRSDSSCFCFSGRNKFAFVTIHYRIVYKVFIYIVVCNTI